MEHPPGTTVDQIPQLQAQRPPGPATTAERKLALLYQIFSLGASPDIIQSVKILHQQDGLGQGALNYGFVEFRDHHHAEQALQTLNGKKIFSSVILNI
ncbi:hypothetical protein BC829DRAFT_394122 [Chytridium lagenaria]|nr:hypothetical protein BC829DRAFT_394122 [Chytridium lagenaria]